MNWNELTVEQYQRLYKTITSEGRSNLDVLVEVISTCEGIAEDEIDSWPFEKLVQKEKEYSFLEALNFDKTAKNYIDANGKRYYFVHQIEKIPAARYIEVKHFGKGDFIENLHTLMASCVLPMKKGIFGWKLGKYDARKHSEYANDLKQAKFVEVYNCVVFFYLVLSGWISSSQDYLKNQFQTVMTPEQSQMVVDLLVSITDGYTVLNKSQNLKESV